MEGLPCYVDPAATNLSETLTSWKADQNWVQMPKKVSAVLKKNSLSYSGRTSGAVWPEETGNSLPHPVSWLEKCNEV